MNRHFRGVLALAVLAAVAGCSTSGGDTSRTPRQTEKKTTVPVDARKVCGGLLGERGGTALGELTGDPEVLARSGSNGTQAMEWAVDHMRSNPAGGGGLSGVCAFRAPSKGVDEQPVNLEYGWSTSPKRREPHHFYYAAGSSLIDLDFDHPPESSIYFSCRTGRGDPGVVKGRFHGGWYKANLPVREMDKKRAQVLLATAEKMSAALGCANKPTLSPDAGVKALDPDDFPEHRPPLPDLPTSGAVRQ